MKRIWILALMFGTLAIVVPANAATSVSIDGTFKESYPKGRPDQPACFTGQPCGLGQLHPYGKAAETFDFEGFDGKDANGCNHIHGTTTITLDDADRSSFQVHEADVECRPGNSHDAPGHFNSYGNPFEITGSWTFASGSATGTFADACGGSGDVDGEFAGSAGVLHYDGSLTFC